MPNALWVDPPKIDARRFGLFSVADVQDITDPHMLMPDGIEWETDNCAFGSTVYNDVVCVTPSARAVTHSDPTIVRAKQFQIGVYTECAGINEYRDAQDRAVRILNLGLERGVEYKLTQLLAADPTVVDYTPGAVAQSPVAAVAAMETVIDDNYAGVGTMSSSRRVASLTTANGTVNRHGNRLETVLGTKFAASSSNNPGPGGAAAGTGNTWLWGMGQVTVRLGKQYVSEPMFLQTADANEVQTVAITGVPTGGSFTLTFDGQTTAAIAWNANAAAVQSALVALSNVDAGDITVTGTNPSFTLTFGGQYGGDNVPQVTATPSLTGGTAPSVTTGTTTAGADNFGDNSYRVLAVRSVIVDWDCFGAGIKVALPA